VLLELGLGIIELGYGERRLKWRRLSFPELETGVVYLSVLIKALDDDVVLLSQLSQYLHYFLFTMFVNV
jgi:hypothetical protein